MSITECGYSDVDDNVMLVTIMVIVLRCWLFCQCDIDNVGYKNLKVVTIINRLPNPSPISMLTINIYNRQDLICRFYSESDSLWSRIR